MAANAQPDYKIQLPVYEGPLDLLLDLVRKQEIDIHNIPIAKITQQYLDYLHRLEKLNVDISADFLYMAATLIHIKSKMLLPVDPLAPPEEQDPRNELVHSLLEHEKFKNAAQMLYQKQQLEAHVWSHPDMSLYQSEETEGELVVSLVDLVRVFQQVMERRRAAAAAKIELAHEAVSVAQMVEQLRARLAGSEEAVSLAGFFEACASRRSMIVALLAVLEMVRMQAVVLAQEKMFGDVLLRKSKMFDAVFESGGAIAKIDEEYL